MTTVLYTPSLSPITFTLVHAPDSSAFKIVYSGLEVTEDLLFVEHTPASTTVAFNFSGTPSQFSVFPTPVNIAIDTIPASHSVLVTASRTFGNPPRTTTKSLTLTVSSGAKPKPAATLGLQAPEEEQTRTQSR